MIPERWRIREFYDVASIKGGLVDPKSAAYRDHLHVGPEDIEGTSGTIIGPLSTAAEIGLISGKFEFSKGDILYSKIRPNLNKVARATQIGICSADMYVVATADDETDIGFLYHLLRGQEFYKQAVAGSMRSGLPKVNRDDLGLINVTMPPLPEQPRIAAVLDAWDDAIATAKNLVAAKEERLTWLADQLVFQAIEWLTIGDVAEQVTARAGSGFKSFDVFSCTKHDGLVLSDDYFTKTVYGADRTDYKVVHPLELAYATNHIEEGSIGLNTHGNPGIVSPMYTVFKATGIDPHFLIAVLKTERMRREFERRTPASVNRRGGLRWGDFAEIEIPCPSADEQARVLSMLDCARADFKAAEDYLALLRDQKRGLMQKLLTGQWRVPESVDALLPGASEVAT